MKECGTLAPSPIKSEGQSSSAKSTFHPVLLEGADHFYRSNKALHALDQAIVEWYDALED